MPISWARTGTVSRFCPGQIPIDETLNGEAKLSHENRILLPAEISQPPRALWRQADGPAIGGGYAACWA